MKYIKHLLFLSILCSLLLFTNCSEEDAAAIEAASKATLSVTASPSEGGTISPQGGTYDAGTTVEVTATANADYSFSGWTGDFEGLSNPVPLIMLKDQSITANFELINSEGNSTNDGTNDGELIYLDANGVTIKASNNAVIGEEYSLNDKSYLVVDKTILREMLVENKDVSKVVTTFITNMDDLFGGGEYFEPYNDAQLDIQRDSIGFYEDTLNGIFGRYTGEYEYAARNFDYDISGWDVSNVISMVKMFAGMRTVRGDIHDLTNWDVSKVTSMKGLLKNTQFLGSNFSGWDVSNVEDFSEILMNSSASDSGYDGIANWNTSNVKNMRRAIYGTFISLNWDVSSVENMSEMFMHSICGTVCYYIENWDVSNVKDMSGMFQNSGLNTKIGIWNVSKVENMSFMFKNARYFSRDISDWDVSNVKNMRQMFYRTGGVLENPKYTRDISNWDVSNVIDCLEFSDAAGDWRPNFTNCSE